MKKIFGTAAAALLALVLLAPVAEAHCWWNAYGWHCTHHRYYRHFARYPYYRPYYAYGYYPYYYRPYYRPYYYGCVFPFCW